MKSEAEAKVRDRIRKLQSRTASRGFTEAEALQATAKAAELMKEFGLTEADLVMDRRESVTRYGTGSVRAQLWNAIAIATNSTATFASSGHMTTIIWIGLEPGPAIAVYLQEMLDRSINRELAEFRKGKFYRARRTAKTKRQAAEEFVGGLVGRLFGRLREMFRETRNDEAREAAHEARRRAFPNTKATVVKRISSRFDEAREAGWAAGGRVGLARGVETDEGPAGGIDQPRLQIEHRR